MKSVADGRWRARRRLVVGEEAGAAEEEEEEDEAEEEAEDPPTLISPSSGSEYDRFFMAVVALKVEGRLAASKSTFRCYLRK
jgi:ssDNA-binding replication factor A large subunit